MKNKTHRVLVDLKIAMNNGYCGIAKENRLIFKVLSQSDLIQPVGLLVSAKNNSVFSTYVKSEGADAIAQANRFFHEALNHELLLKQRILKKLQLQNFYALKKRKFDLYRVDDVFDNVVWRNVFDKSLGSDDKALILQNEFVYTDMASLHLAASSYLKKKIYLNTSGHDFAVFLEPTSVSVSSGTTKVVRYHDTIPLTEPDFGRSVYSHSAFNKLKMCAEDSYFVCNSEPTRQALLEVMPKLEDKALMIPCSMSGNYKKVNNIGTLKQIIAARFSSDLIKLEQLNDIRKQILNAENINYIFNLATLDPKKNHAAIIKAWEKLNYQYPGRSLKLIIAANPGWFSEDAKALMRPHVEMGNIIHLNNLSVDDVPYLFSHAKAFVFPSYTEGFGLPPLEAMQCECPTIVSDIPAHRWVLGDASLYCNPYDANSLTDALEKLIYSPQADGLRQELALKGLERVERYSEKNLGMQWTQLFDEIKRKQA